MYEIITEGCFDSAHRLMGYEGKCKDLHGHTWMFKIRLRVESDLDEIGISVDFKAVKGWIKEIEDKYDHKYLNDVLKCNPTAEVIARKIWTDMEQIILRDQIPLTMVDVCLWETPTNCIRYVDTEGAHANK